MPGFMQVSSIRLIDHHDADVSSQPALAALESACRRSISNHFAPEQSVDSNPPRASDSELDVLKEQNAAGPGGVAIAYLIMGHRRFAHASIARLLRVLWHAAHLFLVHLDTRTDPAVVADLRTRFADRTNVRLMNRRRAVGWGAFSMIEVLLDAISQALEASPTYDFFINLSDADVALRTVSELGHFLAGFRGRSFVSIKYPEIDGMRYNAHTAMRRSTWLECEGEGFLVVNQTAESFFGAEGRRCCYARSGPIVYATLPVTRPPAPNGCHFYHGSQWTVLARNAASWLVHDPMARRLAAHVNAPLERRRSELTLSVDPRAPTMRYTYMADETFVQTALMASPLRETLVNHNLRYIDWPHGYGDPIAYWQSMGQKHMSGPMILTHALFASVARSPAIFARKVDLEESQGVRFVRLWDEWMSAKLVHAQTADVGAISEERSVTTPHDVVKEASAAEASAEEASAVRASAEDRGTGQSAGSTQAATAARILERVGQPPIASTLLAGDKKLRLVRPPLSEDEVRKLAEKLSPEEIARLRAPRSVHFGHEDVMAKQFQQEVRQQAATLPTGFEVPRPIPLDHTSTPSQATPLDLERLASVQTIGDASHAGGRRASSKISEVRLAQMTFTDGSSCSCDVWCTWHGPNACCAEWQAACSWHGSHDGS